MCVWPPDFAVLQPNWKLKPLHTKKPWPPWRQSTLLFSRLSRLVLCGVVSRCYALQPHSWLYAIYRFSWLTGE